MRADGFVPWVANPELTRLSPSQPVQAKRHVLVIHDLAESDMDRSAAHRFGGILLEPIADRYAGILVWWETGDRHTGLCTWLAPQQDLGVPVVLLGQIPGNPACNPVLGSGGGAAPTAPLSYRKDHPSVAAYQGERLPALTARPIPQASGHTPWLTVLDDQGQRFSPVYTHGGGGVASAPYIFQAGPDDQALWLFNPFEFLKQAFGNPPRPAIDTTTENGRRILTVHIDGDGFVSRGEFPGSPFSAQVIQDEIIARYDIPHTVSVIEAETSPEGLYPGASERAERLARSIFQMESVEVASHTYSHPFFWQSMEGGPAPRLENTLYGYFMNIPDYQASLAREVGGSVSYINRRLAPDHKPVSVFLWTGDARPGPEALRRVREAGLVNVNGGNTRPLPYASELAGTWPNARPIGDELQVYAPVMNENVYTNEWTGPFCGFRDVIDSFRILEEKGRLEPMGIYYHFYSGTKPESLGALHEIYRYALNQPVTPLYLSDYAKRVQTFYYSALLQDHQGGWHWRGIGQPRTVTLSTTPPPGPRLVQANGVLTQWQRERQNGNWRITIGISSHQPLVFSLAGTRQCKADNPAVRVTADTSTVQLSLPSRQTANLALECQ